MGREPQQCTQASTHLWSVDFIFIRASVVINTLKNHAGIVFPLLLWWQQYVSPHKHDNCKLTTNKLCWVILVVWVFLLQWRAWSGIWWSYSCWSNCASRSPAVQFQVLIIFCRFTGKSCSHIRKTLSALNRSDLRLLGQQSLWGRFWVLNLLNTHCSLSSSCRTWLSSQRLS